MIDDFEIDYRWKHRDEFISVCGCYLNEDEVQYLIEVLKYMREDGFLLRDRYRSGTIVRACLQDMENDGCPTDTAEKLLKMNKTVGEYA